LNYGGETDRLNIAQPAFCGQTAFLLDYLAMTPEEKNLLERTLKLAEENNILLLGLRRSNRVSTAMRIAYWVVIIALSFGAFYLIQPYFTFLTGLTGGSSADGTSSGTSLLPDQNSVQDAATSLKQLLQGK